LAAEALGNPDRKTFVSALENNRLAKITPNTAKRFSAPLGLRPEDVPASLRWPGLRLAAVSEAPLPAQNGQAPKAVVTDRAIATYLNQQMGAVLRRSLSEIFRHRLRLGLGALHSWTGAPFSWQSLLFCYALSLLYLVAAGLLSFFSGDVILGAVRPFRALDWVAPAFGAALPYLGLMLLLGSFAWCLHLLRPFGVQPMSEAQRAARLASVALIAGVTCGLVDYLGTTTMTAAALFSVPSVAAISTLPPRRAASYGAAGGILFGVMAAISSGLSDAGLVAFLTSISEGIIIGGIVGSCAGLVSSLVAQRMPRLRAGQVIASGGGIGLGALMSLAGIVFASQYSAISPGMVGLFALTWLALPIANAALDFVSLGVSHAIGRYLVRTARSVPVILLCLALDVVLAVLFMLLTVVLVGLALSWVTWGLGIDTSSGAFLAAAASDPWGQGLWVTLMALSTTLWTVLHLCLVVAPLVAGALVQATVGRAVHTRALKGQTGRALDLHLGALIPLRFAVFYGCWGIVAAMPFLVLIWFPNVMEQVVWLGWQLFLRLA
jgi:hypothetical protein